jgi:hypothetical protein
MMQVTELDEVILDRLLSGRFTDDAKAGAEMDRLLCRMKRKLTVQEEQAVMAWFGLAGAQ